MLRTLLTPLVARFDLSPRTPSFGLPQEEEEQTPEDFAREVMIELMRNATDKLKAADTLRERAEILAEIQKIMLQDEQTKEVFRELDGFLLLMSVLSTLRVENDGPVQEPEEQILLEVLEAIRMVFMIISDAVHDNAQNAEYFKEHIGYDSLSLAIRELVADKRTADVTLGFLLAMSLNDFALSGIFTTLRSVSAEEVDEKILEIQSRLIVIRQPDAIRLLWDSAPSDDPIMRYAVFKLFELLCASCHRNHAILSTMGIMESLISKYLDLRQATDASDKERQVAQRLIRRLLELGSSPREARFLLQRVVTSDKSLDLETLEVVRTAMKSKWLQHFSLESPAAMIMSHPGARGVPPNGFTFAIWLWIEQLPKATLHPILTLRVKKDLILALSVRTNGKLELRCSANREPAVFNRATVPKKRWCHITLVYYPNMAATPSIRLFIDGVLNDTLSWVYPKPVTYATSTEYVLGSDDPDAQMSWCIGTAYLFSAPLGDDLPRLIHHLGPRYQGCFQDPSIIKFLTYEASTSLNMFLMTAAAKGSSIESLSLMKAVRDGLGIPPTAILFSMSGLNVKESGSLSSIPMITSPREFAIHGDVLAVKASCLDLALWKIGGTAVPMRLLQLAKTPHEISRTLSILLDSIRNSWQNSDDMERMRGYDIVADILRPKAHLINLTSFETLFEAMGLNFKSPEYSTVVNVIAYKSIALDFELWSQTRRDIQQVYLDHFLTLLEASRFKAFNMKQRMSKLGLVRRLLFVLQTEWFQPEHLDGLIAAMKAAAKANFSKDEAIKPVFSYIAANIHEGSANPSSPRSVISRIDFTLSPRKAELLLDMVLDIITVESYYAKFAAVLPVNRICLLLLGDKPSPFVAARVLHLVQLAIRSSTSFSRKFELISGWSVLKTVVPEAWDIDVNRIAFEVMRGQAGEATQCPQMVPVILSALQTGLNGVARDCGFDDELLEQEGSPAGAALSTMECLVMDLINVHATTIGFRQVFKSQQTTKLFVDAYRSFTSRLMRADAVNRRTMGLLEKISHFGIALAVDDALAGAQKREIQAIHQDAEALLNPSATSSEFSPALFADLRSVRDRFASARFSMQVSERTVMKTIMRMLEWRKTIKQSERKRLRKALLDLREYRRQVTRLNEWSVGLMSERGIWPNHEERLWRLDETEGPHRIRCKLEPETQRLPNPRIEGLGHVRDVSVEAEPVTAVTQLEVPPWAESYEVATTELEERQLMDDVKDDKLRRVRHELEPKDVVEAVATVARIAGVDSSPGLLIIGKTHLYMLDGLVENDEGEVIDAFEAPQRLFFVPGSKVELDGPQKAQRWSHNQIETFSKKTFLFRDVGLEIYFKDSRSLLVVFLDKRKRSDIDARLTTIANILSQRNAPSTPGGFLRTPLLGLMSAGATVFTGFREDELATAQRKWQAREISNYTYLSILNQISGRTPSDATQYPVFPWVIQDYSSSVLDLNDPNTFRDLTKPMGALNEARAEAARVRYESLESVGEKPFHYGTHFSSSMIVCHFLIRLAPYTNMFKTLQGGDWDLPDRLFASVGRMYDSAAKDVRGDVRELIPEFFTCPEFLDNVRNIDFGVLQSTGEKIHDVKLPPWARDDPLLFITLNRRALESSYVSENLPAWIDLIWGCKQRDPAALNCYHPLSYEGSIDLDSIQDDLEREATVGIIHNFGQTPRKLFEVPHPQRFNHGLHSLPLGTLHGVAEDAQFLNQDAKPLKDLGSETAVRELALDMIGERIIPCPAGRIVVPSHPHEQVEWGTDGLHAGQLRVLVDNKVVQVVEGMTAQCATFADLNNLVTGSNDYAVRIWRVGRNGHGGSGPAMHITLSNTMRMHEGNVMALAASRPWSIIVSGSEDGSAAVWDLNRGTYIRSIWHPMEDGKSAAVSLVTINESTGYIATCSRNLLMLHTINGRRIASLDLTQSPAMQSHILSMAFHEREYSSMGVLATGGADGSIVLRSWTADGTPEGEKARWEFITLRSMKARASRGGWTPAVTALKFLGESLCHGEENGKSFLWTLPD